MVGGCRATDGQRAPAVPPAPRPGDAPGSGGLRFGGAAVSCTRPLHAYRASGGGIAFSAKAGFGDQPLELRCGRCQACRLERSRQWATRAVHESALHDRNAFVTLTYSPECIPEDFGLRLRDWQLFAKRARKRLGRFRFLACGEYGGRTLRPHFHACVFGQDFDRSSWEPVRDREGLFTSPVLHEIWKLGQVSIGDVSWQSAAYVARYVMGKAGGELARERYSRVDSDTGECWEVRPEFAVMSRRPGLGAEWFARYKSDVFPADEVVHAGKRLGVPKFYDTLLEREDPEALEAVKRRRIARARSRQERELELADIPESGSDLVFVNDRLRVSEGVVSRRVKALSRDSV